VTSYKGVMGQNWNYAGFWQCPPLPGFPVTTYINNLNGAYNGDGMFYINDNKRTLTMAMISDGLSNTFAVGENTAMLSDHTVLFSFVGAADTCCIPPNAGISNPRLNPATGQPFSRTDFGNMDGFKSYHPGGLQFAFADGSVHFISETISMAVYRAMSTVSGGEVIPGNVF
jgi:prepilin-type processing-associated H-X9-DG protein